MKLPQIRLQSQMVKVEINTTPPKISIKQPRAIQSIEQPKATIRINTTPGKLTIDQSQAWRDMGLPTARESIAEASRMGKQEALEGIARRSSEGDELMRIEYGGNPISSIAINNAYDPMREFNIGWIPSMNAVKINYKPADVKIDIKQNKPIISAIPQKPILNYEPGRVEYGIRQQPNLEIDFVNVKWKETNI